MTPGEETSVKPARKGLAIFFAIVIAVSAAIQWYLYRAGDSIRNHLAIIVLLMWTPGIASIITRLAMREGFRDVSFRFGGRNAVRPYLIAWLFPVAVGAIAYGIAWSTGLGEFSLRKIPQFASVESPILSFVLLGLMRLTIGVVIAAIAAAGEEIGWRGYMVTRMVRAGIPQPLILSGLFWGVWHTPLILSGQYVSSPQPVLAAILFVGVVTAIGYLFARLRLESGSVWPCIVGHSAWNSVIQGLFDFSTTGANSPVWVGESGICVLIVTVVFVSLLTRRPRPWFDAPGTILPQEIP